MTHCTSWITIPVRIGHLEEPLAPRLGLQRGRDLDAAVDQTLMVGVDITHDEHHQQTTGGPFCASGLNVESPVRRKMRLKPASGRLREWKPSPLISVEKPKWAVTKAAEASGSATLSETAEAVISIDAG